jgi:hypothetical protein
MFTYPPAPRAFDDLDLRDIVGVAAVIAAVAHAVDEDVRGRVEAAHAEIAEPGGEAILTRVERNARRVLQNRSEIAGALLLEHLFRHDADRERQIHHRRGRARIGERAVRTLPDHGDRRFVGGEFFGESRGAERRGCAAHAHRRR